MSSDILMFIHKHTYIHGTVHYSDNSKHKSQILTDSHSKNSIIGQKGFSSGPGLKSWFL